MRLIDLFEVASDAVISATAIAKIIWYVRDLDRPILRLILIILNYVCLSYRIRRAIIVVSSLNRMILLFFIDVLLRLRDFGGDPRLDGLLLLG